VGFFGSCGRLENRSRQPVHHGLLEKRDLARRCRPVRDIDPRLCQYDWTSDRRSDNEDLDRFAPTLALSTLNRLGGLKHEGARHHGKR
jgi:hypothetical protein